MAARKPGVQKVSLVLKLLDTSEPPSYRDDSNFYSNRGLLFDHVQLVSSVMLDPGASEGWQPMILNIRNVAQQTDAYFRDVQPNPARDEFLQDWDKVRDLAG